MSTSVNTQVHSKFKVFVGDLAPDKTLGKLADEVTAWAHDHKAAAKSIGVEYLESAGKLVITMGYRDDEAPYPIELKSISLGHSGIDAAALAKLEHSISEASNKVGGNVICHEIYVTAEHDFIMVFLVHK